MEIARALDIARRQPLVFAKRILRNWLGRYRFMPWERIAGDYRRARFLRRGPAPKRPSVPRAERIVVTLTTVPERAALLGPALRSLIDQTLPADRILLAWPRWSIRTGAAYPPPPDLPEGVEILDCEDLGPATKLLPALQAEPSALLIVADDDVVYPYDFIETLVRAHRADPGSVPGWRGWKLEAGVDPRDLVHVYATGVQQAVDVDILLGTWGYLVPPGALDEAVHDYTSGPPEARLVDDIWISGHLARRGIKRRVIPAVGLPIETRASGLSALTLGPNRSGRNDAVAIAAFARWW